MLHYPTTFAETLVPVDPDILDVEGRDAVVDLNNRGFEVVSRVRREDVPDLAEISAQEGSAQDGVREFCRNDLDKRFANPKMMAAWHEKDGGRGTFLLRQLGATAGHGWTGPIAEDGEERKLVPGAEVTFAIRLSGAFGGQGLAVPFTKAIVWGSVALYGARNISLETWGSNTRAVRTYLKAGAEVVTTADGWRPTLKEDEPGLVYDEKKGYFKRRDVRLFMRFPRTFEL